MSKQLPSIGLGTWKLTGDACRRAVVEALGCGYRHVDTAQGYANEREVGQALCEAGITRDQLFVTTKVWPDELSRDGLAIVQASLERLRLDRVDLLLLHWPSPREPLERALEPLALAAQRGLAQHVGVSNFTLAQVDVALRHAPIVCDQVELHPFLQQRTLVEGLAARGVTAVGYSPLAFGKVAHDPVLQRIGRAIGRSATQVALRWALARDTKVVPKASSPQHLRDNLAALDFELPAGAMQAIAALERGERLVDPEFAPQWDT